MSKVLSFPYGRVVSSSLVYYVIMAAWPEEGLFVGDKCAVIVGAVCLDQIICLRYRGRALLSKLISRDSSGTITVCGRRGNPFELSTDQYRIEGALVKLTK